MKDCLVISVTILIWCLQLTQSRQDLNHLSETENSGQRKAYNYDRYLSYPEMEERLKGLQAAHSNKMSLKVAGKSFEGRNIYLVTIFDTSVTRTNTADDVQSMAPNIVEAVEDNVNEAAPDGRLLDFSGLQKGSGTRTAGRYKRRTPVNQISQDAVESLKRVNLDVRISRPDFERKVPETKAGARNPVLFIDGGIHAREWISPTAVLYLIDQLLISPEATNGLEWRIIPVVNPDGYEFSRSSDRMWRKNRSPTNDPRCVGIDLNRNFDVHFSETSRASCSQVYGGPRAFSEPESRIVRDELLKLKGRLQGYVTVHSYGQLILYPYGYTSQKQIKSKVKMEKMAKGMAKAIRHKYNNEYKVAQASILGPAAGGSDDWAYLSTGAPYSFTFELQTKSYFLHRSESSRITSDLLRGFILPTRNIRQAVDEAWLALEYMGKTIIKQNKLARSTEQNAGQEPSSVLNSDISLHRPSSPFDQATVVQNNLDAEVEQDRQSQHRHSPVQNEQTNLGDRYKPFPPSSPSDVQFQKEVPSTSQNVETDNTKRQYSVHNTAVAPEAHYRPRPPVDRPKQVEPSQGYGTLPSSGQDPTIHIGSNLETTFADKEVPGDEFQGNLDGQTQVFNKDTNIPSPSLHLANPQLSSGQYTIHKQTQDTQPYAEPSRQDQPIKQDYPSSQDYIYRPSQDNVNIQESFANPKPDAHTYPMATDHQLSGHAGEENVEFNPSDTKFVDNQDQTKTPYSIQSQIKTDATKPSGHTNIYPLYAFLPVIYTYPQTNPGQYVFHQSSFTPVQPTSFVRTYKIWDTSMESMEIGFD